jgi:hypothetical protein
MPGAERLSLPNSISPSRAGIIITSGVEKNRYQNLGYVQAWVLFF